MGVDYSLSMFVKVNNSEEQNNKIKSLVKFWTNNDYVPISPALNIQFKPDSDDLPNSHTCFNTIDLPAYQTYEKFESKMDQSISSIMYDIGIQDGGKYRYLNKKYSRKRVFKKKNKNKKKNMQNGGFNLTKKIKKVYIKKKVFHSKKKTFKKNNNIKSKRN